MRGSLRIYLGAAPGVGTTYAMLDEGARRAARGGDVLVGYAESHDRPRTAAMLTGLTVLPRDPNGEFDLAEALRRRPEVVLIDDLAHVNANSSVNANANANANANGSVNGGGGQSAHRQRWQDAEALLEAGIDVVGTVDVARLASLADVVESITGTAPEDTVPDAVVRAAEQIQLVDMTPEALRRRMAHGNIYPSERIDAALGNYFQPATLTALRELALLWVADRVDEGLQRYRSRDGNPAAVGWGARERVVVALTGGPEGDALIRRAARIAARGAGGELIAVHVSAARSGLEGPSGIEAQRLLVESLGGSFRAIVGDDVPRALLEFARSIDATQIVLGASRRRLWAGALLGPGTGHTVTRLAGPIDVHVVGHGHAGRGLTLPRLGYGLTPRRRLLGVLAAAALLAVTTPALAALRPDVAFATDLSVYLLIVVVVSMVGGFLSAVLAALAGSLLLNYYFAPPLHTFTIADHDNLLAVVIFLLVAGLVSQVVDQSARRSVRAARSRAEAELLSGLAGSMVRGSTTPTALLAVVQQTFGMGSASLLARADARAGWDVLAAVGPQPPLHPAGADAVAEIGDSQVLALAGHPLSGEDQRVLGAFAAQVSVAYRQWELTETARALAPLEESERARTALLNAVSHDLRTPLAAAKAAVSSLLSADVTWSEGDRKELLANADTSLDRLTDLVTNLLDLSRLQAGVLPVLASPVALDEVVPLALDHAVPPGAPVEVDVPADLPLALADAGLLERVIANLVQNALRYTPTATPVRVTGSAHADLVELRVVDRGPGIPQAEVAAVFAAFQRRDDSPTGGAGVGLGLAIARGFAEAMGGSVDAEETPGGGATMVIKLKVAQVAQRD